jgi:hypothetical protein
VVRTLFDFDMGKYETIPPRWYSEEWFTLNLGVRQAVAYTTSITGAHLQTIIDLNNTTKS